MPIYRYRCQPCDIDDELIQKLDEDAPDCERCDKPMTKQVTSATSHFKGEGWETNTHKKGKGIHPLQMQENLLREAAKGPAAVEKYVAEGRSD